MNYRLLTSLVWLTALAGCDPDLEPSPAESEAPRHAMFTCIGCTWGPPVLNTNLVNGLPFDEVELAGAQGFGASGLVEVVEIHIGSDPHVDRLTWVGAEAGVLHGVGQSGAKYSGKDFEGSQWHLLDHRVAPNFATTLTIATFDDSHGIPRHTFEYRSVLTEGASLPTCAKDPDTEEYSAILFGGLHVDHRDGTMHEVGSSLYFGCLSGAVGKAAALGYRPWDVGLEGHQTALRTIRADYCGEGTSFTQAGNALQLRDVLGVRQGGFTEPSAPNEAMWGPDGALCLDTPRWSEQISREQVMCADGHEIPWCHDGDFSSWSDALIWTRDHEVP